ncbi:hypothetical protein V2J09_014775 [Rumex salicifolius]
MAAVASAPPLFSTLREEQREDPGEEEIQKSRSAEELYSSYLGVSFAVFLAFLPKSAISLFPTLQCRNQYLSVRLRQAEEQLAGLKCRRQEDSKANARVVEIFASHRNAWQKEERRLIQQIDESSEEIARMRARIGELERNENALLGEIDELKREIGERDELLNFMSMKTTSSGGEFDGFGGIDGVCGGGKYFNGGFGEDRVSEAEERECIGGERGIDGDVGLLFGYSNGGSGFDPNFLSSIPSKFWSERANPWQDVQYTALDTTYHTKHFVARRESPWKVDGESNGVPSKLKVLEQELSNLERLGKGDFSKAPSLLRKQAKRYQDIAGKIEDLCCRMQGSDPCDTSLSSEFRTQRQTEYLLEAIRLQQRAAEAGKKLVALQSEISSAYAGDELGSGTKIPTRRSLDCIRGNFKEIQRNMEIWLARIVGDLEGILSRDGASRIKEYSVSRCHYV